MTLSSFLVLSTVDSLPAARKIANHLVRRRLAACVNISGPVESHYLWKKKKETAKEYLLFIKTRASRYSKLEETLRQLHPYSVPEIIALPIRKGSRQYLAWVSQNSTGV